MTGFVSLMDLYKRDFYNTTIVSTLLSLDDTTGSSIENTSEISSFWLINLVVPILLHIISILAKYYIYKCMSFKQKYYYVSFFWTHVQCTFSTFTMRYWNIYHSLVDASQDLTKQTKCIVQYLSDSINKYMGVYTYFMNNRGTFNRIGMIFLF